uniref:NADH dehydrogenase subunit 3 n=1 Tax=Tanytarsus formosanus TaxID=1636531 RepID=UPI0022DCD9CA|nr:NADH dehydrogenase subunit 3 [Tanytarsus formosanus]WAB46372.1 NADH dehydrogenase subunit 3 [Tanytarsus formosanus]
MFNLFFLTLIILFISLIVMMISSILSKKNYYEQEKISPFECGFNPLNSSRIPFSIRFFLIAIIFLIFDVEIALILPMIITIKNSKITIWMLTNILFIFILLIGLYHEWNQGSLNWTF